MARTDVWLAETHAIMHLGLNLTSFVPHAILVCLDVSLCDYSDTALVYVGYVLMCRQVPVFEGRRKRKRNLCQVTWTVLAETL